MSGIRKFVLSVITVLALIAGIVVARASLGPREPDLGIFHGVRLGMTASAVRAAFAEPAAGSWQSQPSVAGDEVLAWRTANGAQNARFEFHSGMLVAVRAVVDVADEAASRPPVEASRAVVRTREPGDPGTLKITILARDCPTHAAEAARLANSR